MVGGPAGAVAKGVVGAGAKQAASAGLGKAAAGVAGSAATATKGVVLGGDMAAGSTAVSGTTGFVSNSGGIIAIGGLFFFAMKLLGLSPTILAIFGTILLFFSAFLILKDHLFGWIPVIAFWVWGILFGFRGLFPISVPFLITMAVLIASLLAVLAIFTKGKGDGDVLIGFMIVFVFLLDVGSIFVKLDQYGYISLAPAVAIFLLNTPWFFFLGISQIDTSNMQGSSAIFLNITKYAAVIYALILVIAVIAPTAFNDVGDRIYNPAQDIATEQQYRETLKAANPVKYQLVCLTESVSTAMSGTPFDHGECVLDKQNEDEAKQICEEFHGFDPGSSNFKTCVADELEKREGGIASGQIDRAVLEETTAQFLTDRNTAQSYLMNPGDQIAIPIDLEIKNPFAFNLEVDLRCYLKKGSGSREEKIEGVILGGSSFTFSKLKDTLQVFCETPLLDNEGKLLELDGSYTLVYEAEFGNLLTTSELTRVFVQENDEEDTLIQGFISNAFAGKGTTSRSGKDFARINLAIGDSSGVIEVDDRLSMVATIENLGKGRLTEVRSYDIDLRGDFQVIGGDINCEFGGPGDVLLPEGKSISKLIPLTSCQLALGSITNELAQQDVVVSSYTAYLSYDYLIDHERRIDFTTVGGEDDEVLS